MNSLDFPLRPCWYVYVLKSCDRNWYYVGSTGNLRRRLTEHALGLVPSTKPYRPLTVAAYVAVNTVQKARSLEKYFKTGSGKAVLRKRILTDEAPSSGA